MNPTRLQVETLLVGPDKLSGRLGRRAVMAKLYVAETATLGSIPALSGPLTEALISLGIEAADPTDPEASDFAQVEDGKALQQLLDVAELRALESILGNIDELDEQLGPDRQDWTKFAEHLRIRIKDLESKCDKKYGLNLGTLSVGTIGLGFQESADPLDWSPWS